MSFLKHFKGLFSQTVSLVIVIIISVVMLILGYPGGNFWVIAQTMVPLLLFALAAIGLQLKEKTLASHAVLLFVGFLNSATTFINMVTSFNFKTMSFVTSVNLIEAILAFVIFLYLVLIIISFILNGNVGAKYESSPVWKSMTVAFIFFLLRSGFYTAVAKLILPVLAMAFGAPFYAVLLLLAGVIDVPFNLINLIYVGAFTTRNLSYFLFTAFAFYMIYGAIRSLIKMKK